MTNLNQRIQELNLRIAAHDHLYYSLQQPEISDHEYDALVVELRELTEKAGVTNTVLSVPGHGSLAGHLQEVQHVRPMISLRTEVETHNGPILKFHERVLKTTADPSYVIEPKYDGLAISLRYLDGQLQLAATRGNGETGEDVTARVALIKNIAGDISAFANGDRVDEIRGEVMMYTQSLGIINKGRRERGEKEYVNTRNATAGIIRSQSAPEEYVNTHLVFMPYAVFGDDLPFKSQSECLEWLEKVFKHPLPYVIESTPERLMEEYLVLENGRSRLSFDIDGVVYKLDDLEMQAKMGITGREPRWAIAHKFRPQQANTLLESIDIQVGPTGRLTPVARLTPVFVGGTTVTNVTLSNVFQVRKKGIRAGDYIQVQRAGDVIPEITGRAPNAEPRKAYQPNFRMPKRCPVCGGAVIRNKGEANYHCIATSTCSAQKAGTLAYIVSRGCLDVDGFGEALAQSLVDKGYIDHALDFITLTKETLMKAGLGPLESEKVFKEIQKVRQKPLPLDKFILALAIPTIGERASKKLAAYLKTAKALILHAPVGGYACAIEGLNSLNMRHLNRFIDDDKAQRAAERFMFLTPVMDYVQQEGPLSGKFVVVTGSAPGVSRDDVKELISRLGGSVSSSVSKNTSLVVYGDGAGDKLKKAQELGIEKMTYEEFFGAYKP